MVEHRMRNVHRGVISVPQNYDGYDVLHHSMKKTIEGGRLLPGIYKGKVISVKRSMDPNLAYRFEIMAWIPEIHTSIPEPEVYSLAEAKNLHGVKFYKPISDDVEEPCVGMVVNIMLEDPSNATGYYFGISNHEFDINGERFYSGNMPIDNKISAKKSIEQNIKQPITKEKEQKSNVVEQKNTSSSSKELIKQARKRERSIDSLDEDTKVKVQRLIQRLAEENMPFKLFEARRSQIRQKYLYTSGRTTSEVRKKGVTEFEGRPKTPEGKVTWTLNSNHRGGDAVDFVLDLKHPYWRGKRKPTKGPWDTSPEFMPLWRTYRRLANEVGLYTFGTDWPHASSKPG